MKLFCVLVGCSIALFAQVSSRLRGTVRDTSDAVMQSVKLTVTEINRGTVLTTETNDSGQYSFPTLTVGEYRISAEAPGFKKANTNPIRLDVNQTVEVNLRLEPGQVSETVEVSAAAAPMLQTSDSQIGNLIENKKIVELPLAARDFMQLTLLSAGVSE